MTSLCMSGCGAQHPPLLGWRSCRCDSVQYLLLSQDVAKPLHRCVLVKVGNSVRVLDLDIADGTVTARSKVGVEAYKRLRATVFLGDVDAHAEMFVVFGRDQLDIFEDSHSRSLYSRAC